MKGPKIVKKKAIDTGDDSYLLKANPPDMAECKDCGAIFHDKRWTLKAPVAAKGQKAAKKVLCPACQKIRDGFAEGFVSIEGAFLKAHKDEIINLIKNKETRAAHFNPLDRIVGIKEKRGSIEVLTTTEKLAQRIGQMLSKAYDGEVDYKWSSDTKQARVVWKRNL